MKALIDGLRVFGPGKLAAMAGVAVLLMAAVAGMALRSTSGPMGLLYADLELRDAAQLVDALDRAHIAHETGAGGSRILVPAEDVDRARLLLAKDGLPSGGSIGYEIFDRGDSLTATQFQQQLNQARALEGELSRTIRSINGVRAARVHLVLPRREPFSRQTQDAQASVVLTTAGPRLDREGTQAVVNLVAAAVPGLRPGNIAVVDSRGNVLAQAGQPSGPVAAAHTGEELRRTMEGRLSRTVEEMLERTVGMGRVRVETAMELDFDQVRETQEKYDPDGQVVRSQQTTTGNSRTSEAAQTVTVQNNLPNADAGQPNGAGAQEQRQEETTNYEIGKTVRSLVREQPQVRRISVAVLVDGVPTRGADGVVAYTPRSAPELANLQTLVRGAVGFNEARGDKVEVVNMRFATAEDAVDAPQAGMWGLPFDKGELGRIAQSGLIALVVVLGLLFVLRPMALKIGRPVAGGDVPMLPGGDGEGSITVAGGVIGGVVKSSAGGVTGVAGMVAGVVGRDARGGGGESMVEVDPFEGSLKASSILRVSELVRQHPEASVAVMRNWLSEEGA